jgi:hypothetical protein
MNQLLRRAWDALDSFKQAYPENWHEDDEQVMTDLMKADLKLSDVKLKWVGLTQTEVVDLLCEYNKLTGNVGWQQLIYMTEAKLKEKNT